MDENIQQQLASASDGKIIEPMDNSSSSSSRSSSNGNQFKFDTSRARIIVVCGACGSGKSYATRALLKTLFQQGVLKWIRIYSHTAAANHEYDWASEGCVHPISLDAVSTYHKKLLKAREEQGGAELSMERPSKPVQGL